MTNRWKLEIGYKGKRYYVYDDNWEVCIYEELCARYERFCVMEMSRLQSRHEELEDAKVAVLTRLLSLAQS